MSKDLTMARLRKVNILAGILHLVQMAAVLALSSDFALPVTATYMAGPPGSSFAPSVILFSTPIGLVVAPLPRTFRALPFHCCQPTIFPSLQRWLISSTKLFQMG